MSAKKGGSSLGPYHVTKRRMTEAEMSALFGDLRRGAVPGRLTPSSRRIGPRPLTPPKRTS